MVASDKLKNWIHRMVEAGEYFRFPYSLGDTVSVAGVMGNITFISISVVLGSHLSDGDEHYLKRNGEYEWTIRVIGKNKVIACNNDTIPIIGRRIVLIETI